MTIKQVVADIIQAQKIIKKEYKIKYTFGLNIEMCKSMGCGDLFFESPDGQNGALYYKLKNLGWRHHKFETEYYWGLTKNNTRLIFTEGDIYIKNI